MTRVCTLQDARLQQNRRNHSPCHRQVDRAEVAVRCVGRLCDSLLVNVVVGSRDLHDNRLSGTLPATLGALRQLEWLYVAASKPVSPATHAVTRAGVCTTTDWKAACRLSLAMHRILVTCTLCGLPVSRLHVLSHRCTQFHASEHVLGYNPS